MYVCEKENNSFKIHVIVLIYVRNVNIPFKKDFEFAKIPKHPFPSSWWDNFCTGQKVSEEWKKNFCMPSYASS